MPKLVAFLFLILSLTACGSSKPWSERVEEVRLQNGMTFFLVPNGEAPIFTGYIRFKAGGIDEEPGKTGLAHFLEHMAFKGTEKIPSGEIHRRMLEAGGIDYNATTSKDMTSYFVSLPSNQIRFWAEQESDRIFHTVFREFDEEKNVVLEERRMRVENDPDGRLQEALLKDAFQKSPYRWPTIGWSEDIRGLTVDDLKKFWGEHYAPSDAIGVIVGKFDSGSLKKLLAKTFGKIDGKKRALPQGAQPPSYPADEEQREDRRISLKEPGSRPRLVIAYHKPQAGAWDDYLFDILDQVLSDGRASRLYEGLVLKKIASTVDTNNGLPGARLPNLFTIEAEPLEGRTNQKCLAAIDNVLREIQSHGISDRELQRAKNRLEADIVWRLRTNEGLAAEISYFQIAAGSWRYIADYAKKIEPAQASEIQRLALRYLNPNQRTIATIEP